LDSCGEREGPLADIMNMVLKPKNPWEADQLNECQFLKEHSVPRRQVTQDSTFMNNQCN